MSDSDNPLAFVLGEGFTAGEVSGGLGLGPLGVQYEELFAEALEDGIITSEERAQLDQAADNLGLDRQRLLELEQAMMTAYEAHHKVRIIEQYEEPVPSRAPLDVEAAGDAGRAILLERIDKLETRIRELEQELRHAQANINVEVDLSDLEMEIEDASEDPEEHWRRVRRDPKNPEPLRSLFRIYAARGDTDRQWCASQALVMLGAANADETAIYEKHHQPMLIAPKASVTQTAWYEHLFHSEAEVLTGQIFSVIAPAVLLGRVTALRRDGKLYRASAAAKQDPARCPGVPRSWGWRHHRSIWRRIAKSDFSTSRRCHR
jgi:hypothetical protein